MNALIELHGVGKYFKRFARRRHKLLEVLTLGHFERHVPEWVLQDIDLRVAHGEAVALLGYNGAGKSTLLKLIAGTTSASCGTITVNGRLAALLELGIGFLPELSGKDNIRIAGRLLGFTAAEMQQAAYDIESFSELGQKLEAPLRTYSSGMQARLAFSIATAIRPDILIVDEVLSVGDAYFQHKSFGRIREFRRLGTTLLFVSHDPGAVRALCDRAVLLDAGRKLRDGTPADVLDFYHALVLARERAAVAQSAHAEARFPSRSDASVQEPVRQSPGTLLDPNTASAVHTRSGSGEVRIALVELLGDDGLARHLVYCGERCVFALRIQAVAPLDALVVGITVRDRVGNLVYGTNSRLLGIDIAGLRPGEFITLRFEQALDLGAGSYSLSCACLDGSEAAPINLDWVDGALVFEAINRHFLESIGVALLKTRLEVLRDHTTAAHSSLPA